MARRKVPVINRYPLERGNIGGNTPTWMVIDIGRHLSQLNHRLYRQGMNYTVKIDLDPTSSFTGNADVFALGQSWMNHNAWKLAFQNYLNATAEEREMLGTQKARWEDFRVDHGMNQSGTLSVTKPLQYDKDLNSASYGAGEFELSKVVEESSGTARNFTWGDLANAYNIIDEYAILANTDTTPTTVETDMPYEGLKESADATEYEALQENGNLPPYNATGGLGSIWNKVATLFSNQATNTQRLSTGYFDALCGFVIIRVNGNSAVDGEIRVCVKEGPYKGVHAVPIGTAKRLTKGTYEVK